MKQKSFVAQVEQGVYWSEHIPFMRVRSTFSSNHPYATHFHDCLSLGVVFKGETELCCNGVTSRLGVGQMVLIAPMEPHSCNPVDGCERGYHMFYIDLEWALALLGAPPSSRLTIQNQHINDSSLFSAMMHMATVIHDGREYSDCEMLKEAILANCSFRMTSEEKSSEVFLSWADGMQVSVEESAQELGVRRESFIRSFRRATGVTPLHYRQCLRLIKAQELLCKGYSLVDTALACGYTDQSHFNRMCVKYLSATPIQIKPQKSLLFKK